MSLTLMTTAGSATANAYASQSEVQTILAGIPGTNAWLTTDSEKQKACIMQATWSLDNLVDWRGEIASPGQALLFPRHGLYDRRGYVYEWGTSELDWTTIPDFLKRATALLAFALATTDRMAEQDGEGISSLSIPGLSVSLGGSSGGGTTRPLISASVYDIIKDYAWRVKGYTAARVVRT